MEEIEGTPPKLKEIADNAHMETIPKKSEKDYKKVYDNKATLIKVSIIKENLLLLFKEIIWRWKLNIQRNLICVNLNSIFIIVLIVSLLLLLINEVFLFFKSENHSLKKRGIE